MPLRLEVSEIEFRPKPDAVTFDRTTAATDHLYAIRFPILTNSPSEWEQALGLQHSSLVVKLPRTLSLVEAVKQARELVAQLAEQLAAAARS